MPFPLLVTSGVPQGLKPLGMNYIQKMMLQYQHKALQTLENTATSLYQNGLFAHSMCYLAYFFLPRSKKLANKQALSYTSRTRVYNHLNKEVDMSLIKKIRIVSSPALRHTRRISLGETSWKGLVGEVLRACLLLILKKHRRLLQ